ncbi:MAG: group II intron reverse transcriptase domain-containing protein [Caldilineaceae bacterium]|nr:group II intron reverse transcriptase domain-containing protein [Caldilineaceae bacterium]
MKTYRNLFPEITDFANLYLAFRKARRGKRSRNAVAAFEVDMAANLFELQEELRSHAYRPGAYHNFYVRERKLRLISAAPFRDRVVHHALCRVLDPIWESRFIHDTYACRPGKGTHRALDRAQDFARHYRYVLQCDVHQFFPAIDHAILREKLAHRIADPEALWLIDLLLNSGAGVLAPVYMTEWFPGDDLLGPIRPRGLPIGNLTSQTWANIYLDSLDQHVKRDLKCRVYLRYCDDFLLFHDDKAQLHAWKEAVQTHLNGLRLNLNYHRAQVYPTAAGIPFLGFRLFPTHRRLRADNVRMARRRLRVLRDGYLAGRLPARDLHRSLQAWLAHAAHGDTWRLRRAMLRDLVLRRPQL